MKRFAMLVVLIGPGAAWAAAPPHDVRERILAEAERQIAAQRERILERVREILDEELPRLPSPQTERPTGMAAQIARQREELVAEITRMQDQLRELEQQVYQRQVHLILLRWMERDAAMIEEMQEDPQRWATRAQQIWQQAFRQITEGEDYLAGAEGFRRLVYLLGSQPQAAGMATSSAYNAACGFSLAGRTEEALDWLEIALARGIWREVCEPTCPYCGGGPFLRHIDMDTDLDNVRGTERFRQLLSRYQRD